MPKPAAKAGFAARLTRKVGPLPVWAWAAVILGAYLLWSRTQKSAAAPAGDSTAATPAESTSGELASGSQVPASGQGGAVDNLNQALLDRLDANQSSIDALTSQLLSQPSPYSNYGDAPAAGLYGDWFDYPVAQTAAPAAQPTVPAPTPVRAGAPPAHQTQTAAGVLHWGGLTFTTKAAFDKWARSRGTTTARELSKHPQAKAIYSTLR